MKNSILCFGLLLNLLLIDSCGVPESSSTLSTTSQTGSLTSTNTLPTTSTTIPPYGIAIPCVDASDQVYTTPVGLSPMTLSFRGDIVRCNSAGVISQILASTILSLAGTADTSTTTDTNRYRIAYRTYRQDASPGVGTADIFIPASLANTPSPIVVITHGTVGLADKCAPSKGLGSFELALPFANNGFIVVAPDYAGMGNEGYQGYGDTRDTGYSVLDSVRAVRRMIGATYLSDDVYVIGHSQGGGACYNALVTYPSYGTEGTLKAIVAIAGTLKDDATLPVNLFKYPNLVSVDNNAFKAALNIYAYGYNQIGTGHELDLFDASKRVQVQDLMENNCVFDIQTGLMSIASTYAELYDATFLAAVTSCLESGPCIEPGLSFVNWNNNLYIPITDTTVEILIVYGMNDTLNLPTVQACNIDQLMTSGINPEVWLDGSADHFDIVGKHIGQIREWVQSLIDNTAHPDYHDGVSVLPGCS